MKKMSKNLLIVLAVLALVGGVLIWNKKQSTPKKQVTNLQQFEKKLSKDLGLKEGKPNSPLITAPLLMKINAEKTPFMSGKKALILSKIIADF